MALAVPHIPVTIEEAHLYDGALAVLKEIRPLWKKENIEFKLFTDGITNKLVGCRNGVESGEMVLVRVYGQKTDLLIDRAAETRNMKVMHKAGYAPRLYATFKNGLAYEFVPGVTLTVETVRSPDIFTLVARMLAQMHCLDLNRECSISNGSSESVPREENHEPMLWKKAHSFAELAPSTFESPEKQARFEKLIPSKKVLKEEWILLRKELEGLGSPVVFCHNDLLLGNVIYSSNQVTFIDYEYADYNYQGFDIGNHFNEFAGVDDVDYSRYPSKEFQLPWLRVYLEAFKEASYSKKQKSIENGTPDHERQMKVSEREVHDLYTQVNKFSLASNLFWGVWALIQAEHSTIDFDFLGYGAARINQYLAMKDTFLNLKADVL
ncbi:ethanolamine kinase [Ischnura elegans]|uniref:ethanolamine kinase n=1 Tax=Ischnura elegans TaxID=197161 RepID=UPI001ED88445|nr:ethanolamine kinase [Ischnura elegans]